MSYPTQLIERTQIWKRKSVRDRLSIQATIVLNTFAATLRLFPGITAATFKAFLAPPVRGVILETFGAGNAPQRPELMTALREACDRGVVVVSISQCAKGAVSSVYATGQSLISAGVVPGGDMTPEVSTLQPYRALTS